MKLQIYSIRDRATDAFGNPLTFVAHGQAIREFSNVINKNTDENQIAMHPEDFDLYHLGELDTDTGKFSTETGPRQIAIGKDLKIGSKSN